MRQNKPFASRTLYLFLILALAISMLAGCGKKGGNAAPGGSASPGTSPAASPAATPAPGSGAVKSDNPDQVVATYKDGKVTRGELDKFINVNMMFNSQLQSALQTPEMKSMIEEQLLNQQVGLRVLEAKASDASKKAADTKFTDFMGGIEKDANQKNGYEQAMKTYSLNQADVEGYMKQVFTVMNDADSKVTDQTIQDEYNNQLKADPHYYDVVTVRHILVAEKDPADQTGQKVLRTKEEALKRAKEAKDKLDKGGDFDALAKEYSDDSSKDNGGKVAENEQLGTIQWVPEFKKAAEELAVGKISDPVESQFGYHVMKVDSRTVKKLDEVKDTIRSSLSQKFITDFMTKDLAASYEYKSQLPKPSAAPSASGGDSATPAGSPSASPAGDGK